MRFKNTRRTDAISRWLTPIIELEQGDIDGLCVYYSAAMMLLALHPELYGELNLNANADPIVSSVSLHGVQTREQLIASWIANGLEPRKVASALTNLAQKTRLSFEAIHKEHNKVDSTFDSIVQSIDRGLPVMLCHDSRSLGHHAVVVTGYQIERKSSTDNRVEWLVLADPGGAVMRQWSQLVDLSTGRLEIIWLDAKEGSRRPDIRETKTDRNGNVHTVRTLRYWRKSGAWGFYDAHELFDELSAADVSDSAAGAH